MQMEPDDQLLAFAEQAITSDPQLSDVLQPDVAEVQKLTFELQEMRSNCCIYVQNKKLV